VAGGGHPEPSADLARRKLPLATFRGPWYRIHRSRLAPLHFGNSGGNRFDAPNKEFGVLYAGRDTHCAFIETFGHATGVRLVEARELSQRGLAELTPRRPLRLVDLRGAGLARIGADASLTAGPDYDLAHRWSVVLRSHPQKPDGIAYRARHDPERICAALFDQVKPLLAVRSLGRLDSDPDRLADLLDTYEFGLA
jgi:RES domain